MNRKPTHKAIKAYHATLAQFHRRHVHHELAHCGAGVSPAYSIFDDTHHAVLYQDGREVLRVDLRSSAEIAELLNQFFTHIEPDIEEFERAVNE